MPLCLTITMFIAFFTRFPFLQTLFRSMTCLFMSLFPGCFLDAPLFMFIWDAFGKTWYAIWAMFSLSLSFPYSQTHKLFQWMFNKKINFAIGKTDKNRPKYTCVKCMYTDRIRNITDENTDVLIHKWILLIVCKWYGLLKVESNLCRKYPHFNDCGMYIYMMQPQNTHSNIFSENYQLF